MLWVALVSVALPALGGRAGEVVPSQSPPSPAGQPDLPPTARLESVGRVDGGALRWYTPFSRDGRAFVTVKGDRAQVWDSSTLKPLTDPLPHDRIQHARLVGDGKTLFTAGGREVRFWDVPASKLRTATRVPGRELDFADVSPDGTRFTTIAEDDAETVSVWRTGESRPFASLRHELPMYSAEFDPTGARVVTHGLFTPFHVWSAETGRELYAPVESDDRYSTPDRAQFDPEGRRMLVPQDQGFTLVDADSGKAVARVRFEEPILTAEARFSVDGAKISVTLLVPVDPGGVNVFDGATAADEWPFGTSVVACRIGPGGRWALCTARPKGRDDVHELWDLVAGRRVQSVEQPGRAHVSPDGSTVLVGLDAGLVARSTAVWRVRSGRPDGTR